MAWATISNRKMELKNRINTLESQDMKISAELQKIARESAQEQQANNLETNYQKSLIKADYDEALKLIEENEDNVDSIAQQQALMKAQSQYNDNLNIFSSIQEARSSANNDLVSTKTNALEAEKEQVETQLSAARAEYQSLGDAMKQDIQEGAIKLA